MSTTYILVCMECKSGISLGKSVRKTYGYLEEDTYGFEEFDFDPNNINPRFLNLVESLDHFFMLHRYHELRIIPDLVTQYMQMNSFPHYCPNTDNDGPVADRHQTFMELPVTAPDTDQEIDNLPPRLIEKIKLF